MYVERNISADTDLRVGAARAILPVGALIHTTEGENSREWLQGGSARAGDPASCDCLIQESGERLWLTARGRYAYHAGKSKLIYKNVTYRDDLVSQLLMGVELEASVNRPVTREQYFSLAELLKEKALEYQWQGDYPIYGHYAVARPLGRRSDPTNFDWGVLFAILAGV